MLAVEKAPLDEQEATGNPGHAGWDLSFCVFRELRQPEDSERDHGGVLHAPVVCPLPYLGVRGACDVHCRGHCDLLLERSRASPLGA